MTTTIMSPKRGDQVRLKTLKRLIKEKNQYIQEGGLVFGMLPSTYESTQKQRKLVVDEVDDGAVCLVSGFWFHNSFISKVTPCTK